MRKNEDCGTPGNANLLIGGVGVKQKDGGAAQKKDVSEAIAWRSRGYLPHFENPLVIQHVTFHLADSLPQATLVRLANEVRRLPDGTRQAEYRKLLEAWIDAGHGSCALQEPAIGYAVQAALLSFDTQRYRMFAWVVMPNHVHALFEPACDWTVAKIVASWKKFTARRIRERRRETDGQSISPTWHREYWDRYIRDAKHFNRAVEYIHWNPVKARLVSKPDEWCWSSAHLERGDLLIEVPREGR